ncbi:MAG: PQQ-dependent sugar dehydrogenase, partial [Nitrosomonas sp.]
MFFKELVSFPHFFSLLVTFPSAVKNYPSKFIRCFYLGGIFCATVTFLLPNLTLAAVPSGFKATVIAQNIINPTVMAVSPDGRIFIGEQAGRIRVVDNDHLLSTSLLNIKLKVDSTGERGLLGIALDPNFLVNQWIYVYYTSKTPVIHNRVSRFKVQGNSIVPGSE